MIDLIPYDIDVNDKIGTVEVKQRDHNSRFLRISLRDSDIKNSLINKKGEPMDITGCNVRMYVQTGESGAYIDGAIEDGEQGIFTFLLPNGVTQEAGTYRAEIWLTDPSDGSTISLKPFIVNVIESIRDDAAIEATEQFSALENALRTVDSLNARMDNIVAMADEGEIPEGTLESEVVDARGGYESGDYENLHDAIAAAMSAGGATEEQLAQIEQNKNDIDELQNGLFEINQGNILTIGRTGKFSQSGIEITIDENKLNLNGTASAKTTIYISSINQDYVLSLQNGTYAFGLCDIEKKAVAVANFELKFQIKNIKTGTVKYLTCNSTNAVVKYSAVSDSICCYYLIIESGCTFDNIDIYPYINAIDSTIDITDYNAVTDKIIKKSNLDKKMDNPIYEGNFGDLLLSDGAGGSKWTDPGTLTPTIKSTSKNLLSINLSKNTYTKNGLTLDVNEDGSILINGTATANTNFPLNNDSLQVGDQPYEKGVYRIYPTSLQSGVNLLVGFVQNNGTTVSKQVSPNPFVIKDDGMFYSFLNIASDTVLDNYTFKPMLTKGADNVVPVKSGSIDILKPACDVGYNLFSKLESMSLLPQSIFTIIQKPIFTWIDDDFWTNQHYPDVVDGNVEKVKEICDNFDIKCTFAVPLGELKKDGNLELALELQSQGFHLAAHDGGVEVLSYMTKNGIVDGNYNVAPGGQKDIPYQKTIMRNFECNVNAGGGIGYIKYAGKGRYNVDRQFMDKTQESNFKKYIDLCAADGGWIVAGTHSNNSGDNWDATVVSNIIQYAKNMGMEFMTLNQALRYRRSIYNLYELFTNDFFI